MKFMLTLMVSLLSLSAFSAVNDKEGLKSRLAVVSYVYDYSFVGDLDKHIEDGSGTVDVKFINQTRTTVFNNVFEFGGTHDNFSLYPNFLNNEQVKFTVQYNQIRNEYKVIALVPKAVEGTGKYFGIALPKPAATTPCVVVAKEFPIVLKCQSPKTIINGVEYTTDRQGNAIKPLYNFTLKILEIETGKFATRK